MDRYVGSCGSPNPLRPVLIGSSNDYCVVYAGSTTTFVPVGPIWLGYYRCEDGGRSFHSSLVPGYPGDTSPYAALGKIRTASSGDPGVAWTLMGVSSSDRRVREILPARRTSGWRASTIPVGKMGRRLMTANGSSA